jgi:hypothetical protein
MSQQFTAEVSLRPSTVPPAAGTPAGTPAGPPAVPNRPVDKDKVNGNVGLGDNPFSGGKKNKSRKSKKSSRRSTKGARRSAKKLSKRRK